MSRKYREDAAAVGARARVLIVDDERDIRDLLGLTLLKMGLQVDCAGSMEEARHFLAATRPGYALCLTDMKLPDGHGLDLVAFLQDQHPALPVAVITAFGSLENAVAAMKVGAFDYLAKPIRLDQLRALVKGALRLPGSSSDLSRVLIGDSPPMIQVRQLIEKLARSQAPVYITGESGCGKELAARLIHQASARRHQPFVAVNCGAIPETLMESEFFGYKKGAFTGAEEDRAGFFQAADGGTLFLDEVADLPLPMQVKLLRVIQEKRVRQVGATGEEAVDVRIISATHQQLARCVEARTFRQDLYYRLNVIELRMPPLRERPEDIKPLAEAIIERLATGLQQAPSPLSDEALHLLRQYDYPGNVRELENILERALALSEGARIEAADLQLSRPEPLEGTEILGARGALPDYLDRLEREAILEALEATGGNKTAAARLLGISFRSLRYRLERLGIE